MIRVSCVAVIIENEQKQILLLLRDDKSTISYPNHWTLIGGNAEEGETPDSAAHREMQEEIGMDSDLTFWKRYDRQHPNVTVDQHIYLAKIDVPCKLLILGEGQNIRFFDPNEIKNLKIGFEFDALIREYLSVRKPN